MLLLDSGFVEGHETGEAGAVLALAQRAEVVRYTLGQHRHHAIRKIDRIAAHARLAVERHAGTHIGSDIGDGDDRLDTAFVGRIIVGCRPHRIIMIAGVGRIDSDKGQIAQVQPVRR